MSHTPTTNVCNEPALTSDDRLRVIRAVEETRRVIGHDPVPAVAAFFEAKVKACQRWLGGQPDEASEDDCSSIKDLLFIVDRGKLVACHPNILPIKKIAHATRHMADLLLESKWNAWDEYGDVFDLLSEILRCPGCYGTLYYNSIDPETGRQYDWATIARALSADRDLSLPGSYERPSGYPGCELPGEDNVRLSQSIRQASLCLGIKYEAVAWQIIKYRCYSETPGGPKWSLRSGHWALLAGHTSHIASLLWPMADPEMYSSRETGVSARTLLRLINCVQGKWFDSVTSDIEFQPNGLATALTREMDDMKGQGFDTLPGSEPLFDISTFSQELMESNSLVGDGEDDSYTDEDEALATHPRTNNNGHGNDGNGTSNAYAPLLAGPSPFPQPISRDAHRPASSLRYSRRNQGRRGNFPRTDLPRGYRSSGNSR